MGARAMVRRPHVVLSAIALFVAACSTSRAPDPVDPVPAADPNVAGAKDTDPSKTTVFASRVEPQGTNCAAGGVALLSGPDKNRNGALDTGEVTTTQYVCNGTQGPMGRD